MNNKIAIITGASHPRDIGTAICRKLASKGIDIFFTNWQADNEWINRLQQEIENLGVRCVGMEIDLSPSDAYKVVLDSVELELGTPSILVNNAAHSTRDGYLELDGNTMDAHYAVNMRTTFLLSVEFVRRFKRERANGRIINMTSGQDLGAMPGELAYAATKGAITAFTKSLSAEVAPLGITVNAINPGPTDSTWMTDEIREHLLPNFPMGRIGQPSDVAEVVSFIASDEAAWITGQVIHSEGGFNR
ncbi:MULTISPECIES: SDR family oxidoreductase [Psychrobacillus]|uniref:SDR family oxidoreductase n=1 Tax=Psychrobacillus faecigallinarum TaxID=2762235 RepID=A0ABR8R8T5_9BACI|nr:SDR family oxidoreductase [Psychrobacillus faecigallinarum]MBD7943942.1 SDR family oxidoreductase [Psychrobacillus faecigallinarum]